MKEEESSLYCWLALFVLLLIASFLVYIPSDLCVSLSIPPDSSEYSIGLVNLFEHGKFGFTLNGQWYPSRYPPWFSLTCLTPAYLLSGGRTLCLYWSVLVFSLVLLVLLYKWCRSIGLGSWWSLVPPFLMMFLPDFVFYSRVVMTEIPYVALFAGGALLFLSICSRDSIPLSHWFVAGALVTWSGMVRSTGLPMLLPFVALLLLKEGSKGGKVKAMMVLFAPAVAYEVANLGYNWMVFGNPLRSGYQFWVPVPYDYPCLVFNGSYVFENVATLIGERVIQATLLMLVIEALFTSFVFKGKFGGIDVHRNFLRLFFYLLFQAAVLLALYIGYFWADTRFFLVITICAVPLLFYVVRAMLSSLRRRVVDCLLAVAAVVCLIVFLDCPTRYGYMVDPRMRNFRENMIAAEVLPECSVVVKSGDPNVVDHFAFHERNLTLFPLVREFDYVMAMVASKSIRGIHEPPSDWRQCIIDDLVREGYCTMPFPYVFTESPEMLKHYLIEGKRVFFQKVVGNKNEKVDMVAIGRILKKHGMHALPFGTWSVPATKPNTIRHIYDTILLKGFSMDTWPEVTVAYHEVLLDND